MVDMIANNHIFELSVPAYARAFLFRESSVGGISYKVKKAADHLIDHLLSPPFPMRFERTTFRLGGGRSILLSYGNIFCSYKNEH